MLVAGIGMRFCNRQHGWMLRLLQAILLCGPWFAGAAGATALLTNVREVRPGEQPAEVLAEAAQRPFPSFDPARLQILPISAQDYQAVYQQVMGNQAA